MRLLNIKTLELEFFFSYIPPYAILSHTWGEDEVTLQDLGRSDLDQKRGWKKIVKFCQTVAKLFPEPLEYVWVDTCCIDKTSSAELSESINSMFRWYQMSQVCYALLEDVSYTGQGSVGSDFESSRWFTRGWTLQELIAPHTVEFFDQQWTYIGDKLQLARRVSRRTGIDEGTLLSGDCTSSSVAQKMSWAAERQTTRQEDMAYCLLGLFDISMTMLYGEGEKAFIRLQEEILKEYDDNSIFAWNSTAVPESITTVGVLATHPSFFKTSADIEPHPSQGEPPFITNKGIRLGLPLIELQDNPGQVVGMLSCFSKGDIASAVGIGLVKSSAGRDQYSRTRGEPVHFPMKVPVFKPQNVYLTKRDISARPEGYATACWLHYDSSPQIEPIKNYPLSWHNSKVTQTMTLNFAKIPVDHVIAAIVFRKCKDGDLFRLSLAMNLQKRTSKLALKYLGKTCNQDLDPQDMIDAFKAVPNKSLEMRLEKDGIVVENRVELIRGSWIYNVRVRLSS